MKEFFLIVFQIIFVAALIYGIKFASSRDEKTKKIGKIILWICIGIPVVVGITGVIIFILFFMTCFGIIKW